MDKEKNLKKFIKDELSRYYLYRDLMNQYQEIVDMYGDEQNNPSVGGSTMRMPDSSQGNQSPQERLTNNKIDAESNRAYYQYRLDTLDNWMGILTQAQHDTIKVYVMKYQCKQLNDAANELNYKTDTIEKNMERAISRIYSKIKKIC